MTDLILYREFDPPVSRNDVLQMAVEGVKCFNIHRVDWKVSLLNTNGSSMFCHFCSQDTESVRIALRQIDADTRSLGSCTIHDRPGLSESELCEANVIVERFFDSSVELDDIQAIEDKGAWCLETHHVTFIRTFFSVDRKYMACLYLAPDAESVREAQRMAKMPVHRVWSYTPLSPTDLLEN